MNSHFFCRGFPNLESIHTNLFSKLGIAIDSLESDIFSGYINNLEISLKEEYQVWFRRRIYAEPGTPGKGGNKLRTYAHLKTIMKLNHI